MVINENIVLTQLQFVECLECFEEYWHNHHCLCVYVGVQCYHLFCINCCQHQHLQHCNLFSLKKTFCVMKFPPSLSSFNIVIIIIYDAPSCKSPGAYEDIRTPPPPPHTHTHTYTNACMYYFYITFHHFRC